MRKPTQQVVALCVVFSILALGAVGKIVKFSNEKNSTQHYHYHSETLFVGPTSKIEFTVNCTKGPAFVSWLVVKGEADTFVFNNRSSALCFNDIEGSFMPTCHDEHVPGQPVSTTEATTGRTATTKSVESTTKKSTTASVTTKNKDTTLARRKRRQRREGDDTTASIAAASTTASPETTTNPDPPLPLEGSTDEAFCNLASGIGYKRAEVYGGCLTCDEAGTEHKIQHHEEFMTGDGYYSLWLEVWEVDEKNNIKQPPMSGESTFRGENGFLEARLYPLMVFNGIMGILYLITGMVWLVLLAIFYKDLLRLQFWIGAVILLGMLEMAVAYGDLSYLNTNGTRSQALMTFAQILLATKNTIARLLILVVSMGYGIVKPRLGSSLKQIIAIGCSYFFFCAAYNVTHAVGQTETQERKTEMMVIIPLSVLDAALIWWIFLSLHHTMKILTLRRNDVKLNLYVRFKWVLAICTAAAVLFALWVLSQRTGIANEAADWKTAWLLEAIFPSIFYVILVAIMYIWRPNANSKRYAYAPLETDELENDGDFQVTPNFGSESMKMRTLSTGKKSEEDVEDDLKWVEDNIPTTQVSADNTFPNFPMDSDEELMNTRFEMSKMD